MSETLLPTYGDVTAEYLALRTGAGLVRGHREIFWARGPDSVKFLDSLLSQDVAGLAPGDVARSLLLEPRGKLTALLWVLAGEAEVGLVADAGNGGEAAAHLNRFKIRVDVEIDVDPSPLLELWGPGSAEVLGGAELPVPDGWERAGEVVVVRAPLGGLPRFLVAGVAASDLVAAGAVEAGLLAAVAVRIEAGEPLMGVDVDGGTIPQESGLVPATVAFDKGCYLGQELVARIDSRGHVNRHLRGVKLGANVLPPLGAELWAGERAVGRITSLGESLELRAPVALALVRREVAPGDPVEVRWEGGKAPAAVLELPLDDFGGEDFTPP